MEPHGEPQVAHRQFKALTGNVTIPAKTVPVWGGGSGVVPEVGGTPSMPSVRKPVSGELLNGRRSSRSALDQ